MTSDGKTKPALLAFLICEQALLDEGKVVTLVRVVDTFNLVIEIPIAVREKIGDIEKVGAILNYTVFTRWGPGEGDFTEELEIVDPDGKKYPERAQFQFQKPAGFHFQQVRHVMQLPVRTPGIYQLRVYLDGELCGEHPFKVNIEKRLIDERGKT